MNFFKRLVKKRSKHTNDEFYYDLKELLHFKPSNLEIYKRAFIHRSVKLTDKTGEPINYERLEFLGDAILGSVVASFLYTNAPNRDEGYLTKMRSKVVSRENLNSFGKQLDLIRFVQSNVSKEFMGENIYGNILEALIGAIYLDKGYSFCHQFIHDTLIKPLNLDRLEHKITSYKGLLIEWCQKNKKKYSFTSYEDSGKQSQKHFSVKINIDGKDLAKGRGTSKKKAEEMAAKRAYYALQDKIT